MARTRRLEPHDASQALRRRRNFRGYIDQELSSSVPFIDVQALNYAPPVRKLQALRVMRTGRAPSYFGLWPGQAWAKTGFANKPR